MPKVVIAGAGPAGMMLAAELTLAGTDVVVVERRASAETESSRAGGFQSRTIELLDQRGVAGRFLAAGKPMQVQRYGGIPLDISDFPARHPYGLALWQSHFERILAGWAAELGVRVDRGREVTGLAADDAGVDVALGDGTSLRAEYLVGCDGGRSVVRKAAGIEFAGWDPTQSWLLAEALTREQPEFGPRREGGGIGPAADGGRVRIVLTETYDPAAGPPGLADLSAALSAAYGTDFGVHSPTWISRFTDATRQAVSYRAGRVLLAGDAAHVHPPQGAQGLSIGAEDAVNLGWKLARVVAGTSPASLLDSYQTERHPVGARVARASLAQIALSRTDERTAALREALTGLLTLDEPRRQLAGQLSGLDLRYDLGYDPGYDPGQSHPLTGRRMPDLDLVPAAGGASRVFELLHQARPVLLNLGPPAGPDLAPRAGQVRLIDAATLKDGPWDLPVVGPVPAPAAVLIRPDGYVAWAGDLAGPGLRAALSTWFGPGPGR